MRTLQALSTLLTLVAVLAIALTATIAHAVYIIQPKLGQTLYINITTPLHAIFYTHEINFTTPQKPVCLLYGRYLITVQATERVKEDLYKSPYTAYPFPIPEYVYCNPSTGVVVITPFNVSLSTAFLNVLPSTKFTASQTYVSVAYVYDLRKMQLIKKIRYKLSINTRPNIATTTIFYIHITPSGNITTKEIEITLTSKNISPPNKRYSLDAVFYLFPQYADTKYILLIVSAYVNITSTYSESLPVPVLVTTDGRVVWSWYKLKTRLPNGTIIYEIYAPFTDLPYTFGTGIRVGNVLIVKADEDICKVSEEYFPYCIMTPLLAVDVSNGDILDIIPIAVTTPPVEYLCHGKYIANIKLVICNGFVYVNNSWYTVSVAYIPSLHLAKPIVVTLKYRNYTLKIRIGDRTASYLNGSVVVYPLVIPNNTILASQFVGYDVASGKPVLIIRWWIPKIVAILDLEALLRGKVKVLGIYPWESASVISKGLYVNGSVDVVIIEKDFVPFYLAFASTKLVNKLVNVLGFLIVNGSVAYVLPDDEFLIGHGVGFDGRLVVADPSGVGYLTLVFGNLTRVPIIRIEGVLHVPGMFNLSRLGGLSLRGFGYNVSIRCLYVNVSEAIPKMIVLPMIFRGGLPRSTAYWWAHAGWWSIASGVTNMSTVPIPVFDMKHVEVLYRWHVVFGKRPWTWGRTDVVLVGGLHIFFPRPIPLTWASNVTISLGMKYMFSTTVFDPAKEELRVVVTVLSFGIIAPPEWSITYTPPPTSVSISSVLDYVRKIAVQVLGNESRYRINITLIPLNTSTVKIKVFGIPVSGINYTFAIEPPLTARLLQQLPIPPTALTRTIIRQILLKKPQLLYRLLRAKYEEYWARWWYYECEPFNMPYDVCAENFLRWWNSVGIRTAIDEIAQELESSISVRLWLWLSRVGAVARRIAFIVFTPKNIGRGLLAFFIGLGIGETISWIIAKPGLYVKDIVGVGIRLYNPKLGRTIAIVIPVRGLFPKWYYTLLKEPDREYLWYIAVNTPYIHPVRLFDITTPISTNTVVMSFLKIPNLLTWLDAMGWKPEDTYITGISFYVYRFITLKLSALQFILRLLHRYQPLSADFAVIIDPIYIWVSVKRHTVYNVTELGLILKRMFEKYNASVIIGKHSAVVRICFTPPVKKLPKLPYSRDLTFLGKISLLVDIYKKCRVVKIGGNVFGYNCSLHFVPPSPLPKTTVMRIVSIRIAPVWGQPLYIERKWWYRIGNATRSEWGIVWVNPSNYTLIRDLYRYTTAWLLYEKWGNLFTATRLYYGLTPFYIFESVRGRTPWLDPSNGGLLEYCKWYIFNIWTSLPPDVGIAGILFNGTEITSSIPHIATIVLTSTVRQNVTIGIKVVPHVWTRNGTVLNLGVMYINYTNMTLPRGTKLFVVPLGRYIAEIYRKLYSLGLAQPYRVVLTISAWVVKAEYDYIKSNDYASNNFTIPILYRNVTARLLVHVYDTVTGRGIGNATVVLVFAPRNTTLLLKQTNATGWAVFNVTFGYLYMVCAWARGYTKKCVIIHVLSSPYVLNLGLVPSTVPVVTSRYVQPRGRVVVTVHVMYEDDTPFTGAEVSITYASNGTVVCNGVTDTSGMFACAVKPNIPYVVHVVARVDGKTYRWTRTITPRASTELTFVVPTVAPYVPTGASARAIIYVYNILNGKPISNIVLAINGTVYRTGKTGKVTVSARVCNMLNITLLYTDGYVPAKRTYIVHVSERVTRINIALTPRKVAPSRPLVLVRVYVLDKNGNPITGAHVDIYNASTGKLILEGATNSRGQIYFLIRNGTVINIVVKYGNITKTLSNIHIVGSTVVRVRLPVVAKPRLPAGLVGKLLVYVYNPINMSAIANATVSVSELYSGRTYSNVTNGTGWTMFTVALQHYYAISGSAVDYVDYYRPMAYTCYSKCIIYLPLVPASAVPIRDMANSSALLPDVEYRGIRYDAVIVQVLYRDGAPVQGANITLIVNASGTVRRISMLSDCLGTVLTYVPNMSKIQLLVTWRNRTVINKTFVVKVGEWIVVHLNETSPWYSPEVAILSVRLLTWRGVSYAGLGNATQMIMVQVWTNMPQNITLLLRLWQIVNGTRIRVLREWTIHTYLTRGLNIIMKPISIAILEPTYVQVEARIVKYENDTYSWNNVAWSNIVLLKPLIDFYIIVKIVKLLGKVSTIPLPEDVYLVAVKTVAGNIHRTFRLFGKYMPKLRIVLWCKLPWNVWTISKTWTFRLGTFTHGYEWTNTTVRLPWCIEVRVSIAVNSTFDPDVLNNNYTESMWLGPEIKIMSVRAPARVFAGYTFSIYVTYRTNDYGTVLTYVVNDTTTRRVLVASDFLQNIKNTTLSLLIPVKLTSGGVHVLRVGVYGPDVYLKDNAMTVTVTALTGMALLSMYLPYILLFILLLVLIIAVAYVVAKRHSQRRISARTVGVYV